MCTSSPAHVAASESCPADEGGLVRDLVHVGAAAYTSPWAVSRVLVDDEQEIPVVRHRRTVWRFEESSELQVAHKLGELHLQRVGDAFGGGEGRRVPAALDLAEMPGVHAHDAVGNLL
jgi:hypothetical protein